MSTEVQETYKVTVTIFGQEYTIRGDADPEYIRELAAYVDEKMQTYSVQSSSINLTQVAILAAMDIADEFYQMKDRKQSIDGVVKDKALDLITMLDEGLIGDQFSGIEPF
jgi:cell division protein ZapA